MRRRNQAIVDDRLATIWTCTLPLVSARFAHLSVLAGQTLHLLGAVHADTALCTLCFFECLLLGPFMLNDLRCVNAVGAQLLRDLVDGGIAILGVAFLDSLLDNSLGRLPNARVLRSHRRCSLVDHDVMAGAADELKEETEEMTGLAALVRKKIYPNAIATGTPNFASQSVLDRMHKFLGLYKGILLVLQDILLNPDTIFGKTIDFTSREKRTLTDGAEEINFNGLQGPCVRQFGRHHLGLLQGQTTAIFEPVSPLRTRLLALLIATALGCESANALLAWELWRKHNYEEIIP